jgi:branched-chain amino acid transport system permease protein
VLQRTRYGRILRATAENREMSQALGVNVRWMYSIVFTSARSSGRRRRARRPDRGGSLDMPVELVVEAFAVVVIGGSGRCAAPSRAPHRRAHARALDPLLRRAGDARDLLVVIAILIARPRAPREADRMRLAFALVLMPRSPRSRSSHRPTT